MGTLSRWVLTYLVNAAWQVVMVAAAAALADLLLRRAPSRYRHALWFIALAAAALLPVWSLIDQGDVREGAVSVVPAPAAVVSVPPYETPAFRAASHAPGGSQPLRLGRSTVLRRRWPVRVDPFLGDTLFALYAAFILVRLVRLARAWRKTSTLRGSAFARELPERVATILAGSRDADILFSPSITLPVTLGALRPVILLPDCLAETLDTNELTAALLHEMAHVRRRDYLLNLLAEVVALPLSFHPGAIFLKRRIDETREVACDDLAAVSLESRASYARSLVSMARRIAPAICPAPAPIGYTLGVLDSQILEERVMTLLDKSPRLGTRWARTSLGVGFTILATACLSLSAFSFNAVNSSKNLTSTDSVAHLNFSGTWKLDATKSNLPSPSPDHIIEVIDQHDSLLEIKTDSGEWPLNRPVAVSLFPLLMPDFHTTIDNSESVQNYGPGRLRSKTRWEGQKLLTEWSLEHEGQTVVEGTWLRALSQDGKTQMLELRAHDPYGTAQASAKLVFLKSPAQSSETNLSPGGVAGGVQGGVIPGPGRGVVGGVVGGVPGGVVGGVKGEGTGSVSGVVTDPSGARVPGAIVTLSAKEKAFLQRMTTNQAGEYAFEGVPPGAYELKVESPGFQIQILQRVLVGPAQAPGVAISLANIATGSAVAASVAAAHAVAAADAAKSSANATDAAVAASVAAAQAAAAANAAKSSAAATLAAAYAANATSVEEYKGKPYRIQTSSPFIPVVLPVGTVAESVVVKAKAPPGMPEKALSAAPTRIRVGGNVEAAKLISSRPPEYPEEARTKGVEGTVVLDGVISIEGAPLSLVVISSPDPILSDAAAKAVRAWRYKPTLLNGEPVEVVTTITVRFALER